MPTLNLPQKKKSTYHSNTDMRELRRKAYNNTAWRKTRNTYLHEHPLCEECLKQGRIYAGGGDRGTIQVHHIKTPFTKGQVNMDLLLDSNNLQTLCAQCHGEIHNKKEICAASVIEMLDDLLNMDKSTEEIDGHED